MILLDGNSLIFRAFYAIPEDMATKDGRPTNAVYGFLSMLANLVRDHAPTHLGVAFDRPEPTFRHEIVEGYKGGRKETPESLLPQFGYIVKILEAFEIPAISVPHFEADDIVATLANRAFNRNDDVMVVSGDRDTFQLVRDPHIRVLYNKRGVSEYDLYDERGIGERTGVPPNLYVQYAALRGDPSDNLPGALGVGEKTAAKLINQYGGIDGIYQNLGDLTPKLRENLVEARDRVCLNVELMTLKQDLQIDLGEGDRLLSVENWDLKSADKVVNEFEFNTLRTRLMDTFSKITNQSSNENEPAELKEKPKPAQFQKVDVHYACTNSELDISLKALEGAKGCAIEPIWVSDPGRSELSGCVLATHNPTDSTITVIIVDTTFHPKQAHELLGHLFRDICEIPLVGYDLKELLRLAFRQYQISLKVDFDTQLACFLLGENEISPSKLGGIPDALLLGSLNFAYQSAQEIVAALQISLADSDLHLSNIAIETAVRDTFVILESRDHLEKCLKSEGLLDIFQKIDLPLVSILGKMEAIGVLVDGEKLHELQLSLEKLANNLSKNIYDISNGKFNINSPSQLGKVLFQDLKLTPGRKTKTGFSTDARTLESIRSEHPIVDLVLKYREVEKLRTTYCTGLLNEIDPSDSRIHASFSLVTARTGRISSDRPNLHNIPTRTELGSKFRDAFVAPSGYVLLTADYDQIELRILAHLSEDSRLIEAFRNNDDIHTFSASQIFDVEKDEVTQAQRSKAKMVEYGLSYGMEAFGLASRLAVPIEEARTILNSFFESFPKIREFMDTTVAQAHSDGFTTTQLGRKRNIPDINSSNRQARLQGERQAMNAPIQGLAADIFKLALIRLDRFLADQGFASRIVLQIHDEVLLEVPESEISDVSKIVVEAMTGAYNLKVDLPVHIGWSSTWSGAKTK